MLHRCGVDLSTNIVNQGFSELTIIARNAHFDQFVALERHLDFTDDRRRQAGIADHDHRVEMMGACLEGLAFGGGKQIHARANVYR